MTPKEAYDYALKNGGSDKLRNICCQDPFWACWYAEDIDKVPREDTRTVACKDHWHAYMYAQKIDKGYHRETRKSCYKSSFYYRLYLRDVLKPKYYKEISLLQGIKRRNGDS